MSNLVFGDFETTGIPLWQQPSGLRHQPHIVSMAALLVDEKSREIIESHNLIVKPDGWIIPEDSIEIHGITNEHAADIGISEFEVMTVLYELCVNRKRVFFNTTFDNRIGRIATKRYMPEIAQHIWRDGKYECAMMAAKKDMGVGRYPKLSAAYLHYFGKELKVLMMQ